MGGRRIVVDGSNVAWEEQTDAGKPRVANLIAARRDLLEQGYDPTIVVDATLRHDVDDPHQLEALFEDKRLHQAPAGTPADGFALQIADDLGAEVVSNDLFDPYRERYPWIAERRRTYMIVDGRFYLAEDLPDSASGAASG